MKNLSLRSISRIPKIDKIFCRVALAILIFWGMPQETMGRIYLDINAPSIQKIKIAIPDFTNFTDNGAHPELSSSLSQVISSDLDLSGYFTPMDKASFLSDQSRSRDLGDVRLREWSLIGAELLVRAGYTCIGRNIEMEIRLFDVYRSRQIMGRRYLGKIKDYRAMMHRVGNDIMALLTGSTGIFHSRITFVGTATGHKEIYVSDYDGHNITPITNDQSIALLPRSSPKGDQIVYNSYKEGVPNLYLKHLQTGGVTRVSARKGLNIGAAWAPDAQKLALTLSHKGNPDIYTIDLKGNIIKRIISHWNIDVSPCFSPDGKKMAFVSNRSGSPQIYVLDFQTGKEQRLTFQTESFPSKYNTSPNWSIRDQIAFTSKVEGRFDIFVIDAEGRNLRRLTHGGGDNEDPCWSPDGRYIMFSSNRNGRYHLYIMTAGGQNQKMVTRLKGEQTAPSWTISRW